MTSNIECERMADILEQLAHRARHGQVHGNGFRVKLRMALEIAGRLGGGAIAEPAPRPVVTLTERGYAELAITVEGRGPGATTYEASVSLLSPAKDAAAITAELLGAKVVRR